jgi:hypothetical protein
MVTFAETANADYHSSFADQGKQTSIFPFRLQQTNGSLPFRFPSAENKQKLSFSVSSVSVIPEHREMEMEMWKHRDKDTETWKHGHYGAVIFTF